MNGYPGVTKVLYGDLNNYKRGLGRRLLYSYDMRKPQEYHVGAAHLTILT